jgi:hypothetical protein
MLRLLRRSEVSALDDTKDGTVRTYVGFLALTLVNPLTVIFFTALMLALGDEPLISSLDKALFVIEPLLRVQRGSSRLRERAPLHQRLSESARIARALLGNALTAALALRLALGRKRRCQLGAIRAAEALGRVSRHS